MSKPSATQKANAKINLYLHITGKRGDGLHTLDSLVVFADVGDTITATPINENPEIIFSTSGPFGNNVPLDESNLVVRTAKLLQEKYNIKNGARINLEKNLPPSSGMGGGSADAAAAMRALGEIWNIDFSKDNKVELYSVMASRIGADVPVCFNGKNVFMGGIGEKLDPAPILPSCWLLLVNPNIPVSTPAVFSVRKGAFSELGRFDISPSNANELADILSLRNNDLSTGAQEIEPEIANVISALQKLEGVLLARMSGSGATCFAIYSNEQSALMGAQKIANENPEWWVRATRMLS